mgnify:FL=1|jgi:hypothetical protein
MPMNIDQQVALMREKGFVFDDHYKIRGIMANDADIERLAYDAAMVTDPNSGVPVEFTSYLDPRVIEILTGPRNSREIFAEVKKGDWTTSYARFEVDEITGAVEAYTDYGNAGMADVNPTYPVRKQYVFQTNIRYGDRELDYAAKARLQLAARKQRAAATTIDIAQNKYNLLGVENMEIYGLLNEPNRPAVIHTGLGKDGNTWNLKTTKEIYADYLLLFQNLAKNSLGHIRNDSDLILVTSPSSAVELGKATDFNVSVMDMIKRYTPNIKFAQLPELENLSDRTVLLICRSINGEPTGEFGFSEKMRAMRLVPETSSFKQKFVGTTYGCILYRPFAVATMTGV